MIATVLNAFKRLCLYIRIPYQRWSYWLTIESTVIQESNMVLCPIAYSHIQLDHNYYSLDFAKICSKSTEFHFPDLETQLEEKRQMVEQLKCDSCDKKPKSSSGSSSLQTGDFYMTKHSNLSQIHVAFHLVCDDSLRSSEINSRHPVILGLRNIMKISHLNDISNITIPLLLIHEMTEDITIQWCLKRAELVLKCVKGFMIEMASLSSTCDENRTVQFVVPKVFNVRQRLIHLTNIVFDRVYHTNSSPT